MTESTVAYATRTHLTTLAVPSAAIAGISTGDQDSALLAASRMVDSALVARFKLPLTQWGYDIRMATLNLAVQILFQRRGYSPQGGDAEQIDLAAKRSMDWLTMVAKGTFTPVDVVDSSTGGNNTDATGEAVVPPLVLQPQAQAASDETVEFWEESTTQANVGSGAPTRRGW